MLFSRRSITAHKCVVLFNYIRLKLYAQAVFIAVSDCEKNLFNDVISDGCYLQTMLYILFFFSL